MRIRRQAPRPYCHWLLCLVLVAAAQGAAAQRPLLEFRDIRPWLDRPIPTRPPSGEPPVVREPESAPTQDAGNRRDPSLDAPFARLALDARGLTAAAALPLGEVMPFAAPLIEFSVAAQPLRLALVERVVDPALDAVHLTLVAPDSRDYARLTVSRSGPEIVGTVFLGRQEYRLLPGEPGFQLVYPVAAYRGEFRRDALPDLASRAGRLEARHLQQAWAAERQPERFATGTDGRLSRFEAGARPEASLGQIDILGAIRADADGRLEADPLVLAPAVSELLNSAAHLTLFDEPVSVAIERAELGALYAGLASRAAIDLRQLIDGVVIEDLGSRLEIDAAGRVIGFTSRLVPPATAERRSASTLSAPQAEAIARDSLNAWTAPAEVLTVEHSALIYDTGIDNSGPVLVWRIDFGGEPCRGSFRVDVRASTGEVMSIAPSLRSFAWNRNEIPDPTPTPAPAPAPAPAPTPTPAPAPTPNGDEVIPFWPSACQDPA